MKKQEGFLDSSDGKNKLHVIRWLPDQESPNVWVQLVHGMNEHMGRYEEFAAYLAEHGIAVMGHDCIGHGKTAASLEDRGWFGERQGHQFLVQDIRKVALYGKRIFPEAKHVILGHSMGSFMTRRYLAAYADGWKEKEPEAQSDQCGNPEAAHRKLGVEWQQEPDGVILSGTGNPPHELVRFGWGLANGFCIQKGTHDRSKTLYQMSIGAYNRQFAPVETEYDWLSRDRERVQKFLKDPYCDFIFTAGAYRDMFQTILEDQRAEKRGHFVKNIPYLIISGSDDPVGEGGKGIKRLVKRYEKAGVDDITCHLYPEARHEVLNEINWAEVYEDVLAWLQEKMGERT